MYMDIGSLKPFRNYTVRIFPKSFLGYRFGSEAKMFQTKEAGMKCTKPCLVYIDLWGSFRLSVVKPKPKESI